MVPLQPIKGRKWLYVMLLLGVLVIMFMLKQCSSEPFDEGVAPDAHAGGDTLEVAIEIAPISLTTAGDSLGGEYYEIMRRIAREHGLAVNYTPFSRIETALDGLARGRYDIVIADQPVIASMRDRFLFTSPVSLDRQLLVQRRREDGTVKINSQFDLRQDTVWLPVGSPFHSRIVNLSHEIGDTIYVITDADYATEQLIMLTAIGEIKRTVANERTVKSMMRRYPELDASVDISFTQFQSWVVAPSRPALRDSLNKWLEGAGYGDKSDGSSASSTPVVKEGKKSAKKDNKKNGEGRKK